MRLRSFWCLGVPLIAFASALSAPLRAQETLTYSYDALGRLQAVNRAGPPGVNVSTSYTYDPAGNRTNVTTTGSANSGGGGSGGAAGGGPPGGSPGIAGHGIVVAPLNGYTLIFFGH